MLVHGPGTKFGHRFDHGPGQAPSNEITVVKGNCTGSVLCEPLNEAEMVVDPIPHFLG